MVSALLGDPLRERGCRECQFGRVVGDVVVESQMTGGQRLPEVCLKELIGRILCIYQ